MENECEALPGVAYPGVRDNRSTINTKTGYDDDETQKYTVQINRNWIFDFQLCMQLVYGRKLNWVFGRVRPKMNISGVLTCNFLLHT